MVQRILRRHDLRVLSGFARRGLVTQRLLAHRVANKFLQRLVELFGNLGQTGYILIFSLAQPAECIGDLDTDAIGVTAVLAAAAHKKARRIKRAQIEHPEGYLQVDGQVRRTS